MLKPIITCNRISKTLPLAFDESLSYLEELYAILHKLNETIEQVNKNTEVAEHFDELLQEIEEEVNKLEEDYEEFKIAIENEIDVKFLQVKSELTLMIENEIALVRYQIEQVYNELNTKIDNIIAGDINVYDPTTGEVSPIQVVINNLFDMNRNEAITASEFDALELTATEFDAKEITAFNFDVYGKTLLSE